MLARRWRGDPAILAWDLTDEPPLWLFPDTTDDDARAWTTRPGRRPPGGRPGPPGDDRDGQPGGRRGSVPGRRRGRPRSTSRPSIPTRSTPELYPDSLLGTPDDPCGGLRDGARRRGGPAGDAPRVRRLVGPVRARAASPPTTGCSPGRASAAGRSASWPGAGRTPSPPPIGALRTSASRTRPSSASPTIAASCDRGAASWASWPRPSGRSGDDLDGLAGDRAGQPRRDPGPPRVRPRRTTRPAYGLDDAPAGPLRAGRADLGPRSAIRGPSSGAWLNGFVLAARAGVSVALPARVASTTPGRMRRSSSCRLR